jgi:capsular exopolysaccharide synthesis family protein
MSNKFQLATNQPAADFWTQGSTALAAPVAGSATPNTAAPPPRSPMAKIHRLLRGRYRWAATFAIFGAVAGAAAGWMAVPPKYESAGQVIINPEIVGATTQDETIPQVAMYIQLQNGLILSPSVAAKALQDPKFIAAWKSAYSSKPLPDIVDFGAAIDTEHKANAPLIRVIFSDRNSAVAQAGAHAVMAAYMELHNRGDDFMNIDPKLNYNRDDMAGLDQALAIKNDELKELARKFGTTDLGRRNDIIQEKLTEAENELSVARNAYETALQASNGKPGSVAKPDKEIVYQKISDLPDLQMKSDLANREEARLNYENSLAAYGANNPGTLRFHQQLMAAQQRVEDYARSFLNANPDRGLLSPDGDGVGNLQLLKQNQDRMEKIVADLRTQAGETGARAREIEQVRAEIENLTLRRKQDQTNIDALIARQSLTKTIDPFDMGSDPQLSSDKRKVAAGVGFLMGGLFPIGLMMLYGLRENRFRFSDDASSADLSGVTLLGILPNLPDRLSDPQQAGIAAHCVHQIRTMLQISRSNDEPQVLAITSASAGDGKTSLTLALGLSYAACGARTLLIDCDLIAAGLTHRLNVNSPDGVLEAVANRALLEYVRTTDIADVAILPVGTTHAHHASTLSPVALRRLLSEARKHFDIVIVDTGPILGSIEASLVCAAADRTILTVARNQQRPLVEKSIEHLSAIGSHLAGVVFNRAHAADFAKSTSGVGLRSRIPTGTPPRGPGGGGSTAGQTAAANAVAGSFKRAG